MQKTIDVDIEEIKKNQDNSLNEKDYIKITNYYGLAVPAILGECFFILRGKSMTTKDRLAMTYLGSLTGLFDDFYDKKNTPENHIKKLIDNPGEQIANNSHELLFVRFYKKALENAFDINLLKSNFYDVYNAQIQSKKQTLDDIESDEIKNITFLKGGVSLLFYRCILDETTSTNEKMMLYNLGSLFQLENDIFDIYKDYKNGIKTLATIETKINNLREIYLSLLEETIKSLGQTSFPTKNKKKFFRFISLIILRGLVCLDCLEKKEKLTNNIFSIQDYKRKDLICDMENVKNNISLLNYYAKYNVEFM